MLKASRRSLRATADFTLGIVTPAVQYPAEPLKTDTSKTTVPIPQSLAGMLAAHVEAHGAREHMFRNEMARPACPTNA